MNNELFSLKVVESYESDKIFWHGFIDFYEQWFQGRDFPVIAEFGIFKGDSIRWLLKRFPNSKIYGADILPYQSSWPVDDRFKFARLDQNEVEMIKNFLSLDKFDLIIEDGSHIPKHQVNCLVEGMRVLNPGGLYILEDIHTSLTDQSISNSLNILMAIDHYKRINITMTDSIAEKVAKKSLFTPEQVLELYNSIDKMFLYKRNHLPNKCFNCNSVEFNYAELKCFCGANIYAFDDSMSFVIQKN